MLNDDIELEEEKNIMLIYEWIDSFNFTRPKKNITRDFCDGVLMAELVKTLAPNLVELHNYPSASSTKQKQQNWQTLNRKVMRQLGISIAQQEIDAIISCKPFAVEQVLAKVYQKFFSSDSNPIRELKLKNNLDNKSYSKEDFIKKAISDKDRTINELTATLDILQTKLKNSEDENRRLNEKINQYQLKLSNKK